MVKKKIKEQNENSLLESVNKKYKTLDYNVQSEDKCYTKEYMKSLNLPEESMKFAIRS